MKRMITICIIFLSISLFAQQNNDNWDNDFYLKNLHPDNNKPFCSDTVTTGCVNIDTPIRFGDTEKKLFNQLLTEYGLAIAPGFTQPAETLGSKGFELGVNYTFANVGYKTIDGKNPWLGTYGGTNPSGLNMITIDARKGLPASLELGGRLSYIIGSHLFVFGMSGKFALIESVGYAPDVSLRASYTSLLGSKQVDLNVLTLDAIIGYDFSFTGMMALNPYIGYSLTKISGSSGAIMINTTASPYQCEANSDYCDYSNTDNYNNRVDSFDEYETTVHRLILGFRLHNAAFIFTPEFIYALDHSWSVSTKVGFDF